MTNHEILKAFEVEIGLIDNNLEKPLTADSLYWLNLAVNKFVKTRYNRDIVHHTGYELNEKRFKDLRGLISSYSYIRPSDTEFILFSDFVQSIGSALINERIYSGELSDVFYVVDLKTFLAFNGTAYGYKWDANDDYPTWSLYKKTKSGYPIESVVFYSIDNAINYTMYGDRLVKLDQIILTFDTYDSLSVCYPEDFLFTLNEDVLISDLEDNNKMWTNVFECTADSFMHRIVNSLTDFHYKHKKARPLRVRTSEGCDLLTDKNYKIHQYNLGYIRKPKEIVLGDKKNVEYTDFDDSCLYEIIKIAAQMYLENLGSSRYKTVTQEVLTQE